MSQRLLYLLKIIIIHPKIAHFFGILALCVRYSLALTNVCMVLRQSEKNHRKFIFRYLQQGCTRYFCSKETEAKLPSSRKSKEHNKYGGLRDPIQDDVKNFHNVDNDLKNLGMTDSDRLAVYTTISSVLHLGNIGKYFTKFSRK